MTGKTLDILDLIQPDRLGNHIADLYVEWEAYRQPWLTEKQEIQRYVFATDTTKTSNSKLPWSNKTTIPKLCQIRDNLFANYMATMFPRRKWFKWEGDTLEDDVVEKKSSIEAYTHYMTDRNEFRDEMAKLVLDYIDYGNCYSTVEWKDGRYVTDDKEQVGYVGPIIRRISPLDIVVNPTAPSFCEAPKIIRSMVSMGEVKEMIERMSSEPTEREDALALYDYMKKIRAEANEWVGELTHKDAIYNISGFGGYRDYLQSGYVEVLTFYGDIYDHAKDEFLRNQVVKVIDRHKVLSQKVHPSFFGYAPIYHCGWRIRPDNLYAMGPLDNLVGMQYRIDHLENMKADVFDLIAYPPLKITGYVEDFEWGPFERIYVGDAGNVEIMSPNVQALAANTEINVLEAKMEEMAGSPKEAMGFRTPGEKTKYEVQRLENAAGRVFQAKVGQFEMQQSENLLNASLELSRRNMNLTTVRTYDSELKINQFMDLSAEDITGYGKLKPIAARHFAEKAQQVQDLNSFRQSVAGQDPSLLVHFSTVNEAKLWEHLLEIEDYNIVQPYVRLSEQKEAQVLQNVGNEQMARETMTPSGLTEDQYDESTEGAPGMGEGPIPGGQGEAY
jgi:hypothetical protein